MLSTSVRRGLNSLNDGLRLFSQPSVYTPMRSSAMKKTSALALALLFSFGLAQQVTGAPQFGAGRDRAQNRDRVCVYQDIHYQGWEQCYSAGDEVATLERRDKAISSIRIFGRSRVTVYDNTEFRGRSAEFTSDVPDLGLRNLSGSKSWSDQIRSLRVGTDYAAVRDLPERRTNAQGNDGVCVYDRRDFEGREQCWSAGQDIRDLARSGNWSDRISSIRVFGRATAVLFRDIEFRGDRITIDRDVADLSQVSGNGFRNWDRQVSSLVVQNDRGFFPGRGRARGRF
jgi:hypothetical protein